MQEISPDFLRIFALMNAKFRKHRLVPLHAQRALTWSCCSTRPRRGIFQTYNLTVLTAALLLQTFTGLIGPEVIRLALITLPGTIIGAWLGARLYHALDDRNFRDVVLVLLLLSGISLVWTTLGTH